MYWKAFQTLKESFTGTPILAYWISDSQIIIETDASDYALGAIFSIYTSNSKLYPITFYSHTFTPLELNYDIYDKELLAIFEAFKTWRHYLKGFTLLVNVVTDHKNLTYFSTTKILTQRQAC